jgi:homopolymeric O-antigen transport system ATP-binding protein
MGSIRVEALGKSYKRYPRPAARLAEWFSFGRVLTHVPVWVLRDVSFEVGAGEALAIVGRNGAGKSTLVRLLNGTLRPSGGSIEVSGRVAALELGLRFHGDFTGRQNLTMAGQLQGLSSQQIDALLPDIAAFSELGEYLDQPLRTYSSGMRLRLAFSVATAVRPDVLLVDEALAVGDARFQQKCIGRIRRFLEEGSCLVFVSHDPVTVRSLCSWALLLEAGHKLREGPPAAVLDYYNALLARIDESRDIEQEEAFAGRAAATRSGEGQVRIEAIELRDADGPCRSFAVGAPLRIRIRGRAERPVAELTVGIAIRDRLGNDAFGTNSHHLDAEERGLAAGESFVAEFEVPANLGPDRYTVTAALHAGRVHLEGSYDWWDHAVAFEVVPGREPYFVGRAFLPTTLRFERISPEASPGTPTGPG